MRLVITLEPAELEITPVASGGAYDWLLGVGATSLIAHVAEAVSAEDREAASVEVTISNAGRRAARILGQPLRKRAVIYDDANVLFFDGYISNVGYGREVLTLRIGA
jgi:hypothetical protein